MGFRDTALGSGFVEAVRWLRDNSPLAAKTWSEYDLRWSYLAVAGLIVAGAGVNLLLANGWTVWPVVAVAAILLYVHEAADRNGQGVPPMHVYGLFAAVLLVWMVVVLVLSAVNPVILLLGLGTLAYYCVKGFLRQQEARRLIEHRRANGLCVHCGEPADPAQGVCLNCGEEPNPEVMQLQRVQAVVAKGADANRMRSVLKQEGLSVAARRKEAALLRDRQNRRPGTSGKRR
jgi:hypothetical protein